MYRLLLALALVSSAGTALAQAPDPTAPAAPPPAAPPSATAPAAVTAPDAPQITYVFHSKPPAFRDKTTGSVAFTAGLGSLGGVAEAAVIGGTAGVIEAASGAATSRADAFPNPANLVGSEVAQRVARSLGAAPIDAPVDFDTLKLDGSQAQKYKTLAGPAQYIVDVHTMIYQDVWASYAAWPLDFSHYIVEYMANVTIYDAKAGKEVFGGRCFVFTKRTPDITKRTPDIPTHEQMFANNGAALKKYTHEAADDCVAQLIEKNDKFRALTGASPS
jgi:hypothetical protein